MWKPSPAWQLEPWSAFLPWISGDVSQTFPPRFREGRWFFLENRRNSSQNLGNPSGFWECRWKCLAAWHHVDTFKRRGCYRSTSSPSLPKRCFDKFDKVQLTMQVLSSIYIIIELSSSFVPGKSPPKKRCNSGESTRVQNSIINHFDIPWANTFISIESWLFNRHPYIGSL